jgi:hypothetical protein
MLVRRKVTQYIMGKCSQMFSICGYQRVFAPFGFRIKGPIFNQALGIVVCKISFLDRIQNILVICYPQCTCNRLHLMFMYR